jgi:hypothetical protein
MRLRWMETEANHHAFFLKTAAVLRPSLTNFFTVGEMNGLIRVSYFNDTATVTKWVISKNRMINHLRSCAVIAHLFSFWHQ